MSNDTFARRNASRKGLPSIQKISWKTAIWLTVAIFLFSLLGRILVAHGAQTSKSLPPSEELSIYVTEFNVWALMDEIIFLESTGNRLAKGKHGEIGVFQFKKKTFDYFGELYKLPHNDIYSRAQQTQIARRMLLDKITSHWTTWERVVERYLRKFFVRK